MIDFLIIGGGIAGISAAARLSSLGSVTLLEAEDALGYHASGRSAAMFEVNYGSPSTVALSAASEAYHFAAGVLSPRGFMLIGTEATSVEFARDKAAMQMTEISIAEACAMVPILNAKVIRQTAYDAGARDIDTDLLLQGFARSARQNGAQILTKAPVTGIRKTTTVWSVTTPQTTIESRILINAAGAWADQLGQMAGARKINLQPKRRTVIAFTPANAEVDDDWPVVIDCQEEFYFKVDAGTVLGSPADETPVEPQDVQPEEIDIAYTIDRLQRATTMEITKLQRSWAGLRSFVPDGVPVAGYDPDAEGFCWCAGQGGYGIETSVGMGRSSAALARGEDLPEDIRALGVTAADLSPERF